MGAPTPGAGQCFRSFLSPPLPLLLLPEWAACKCHRSWASLLLVLLLLLLLPVRQRRE